MLLKRNRFQIIGVLFAVAWCFNINAMEMEDNVDEIEEEVGVGENIPDVLPTIQQWSLKQTLVGHTKSVCSLCTLSATQFVSGAWDDSIKIWEKQEDGSWQCTQTLNGHTDCVYSLCALSATQFVSGSRDNSIKIWEKQGDSWQCTQTINGHTSYVRSLCTLSVTQFVSGSLDAIIKIWKKQGDSWQCTQTITKEAGNGHTSSVDFLCTMGATQFVSGSWDGSIKIWKKKRDSWTCTKTVTNNEYRHICSLCTLSATEFVFSNSWYASIKIWEKQGDSWQCTQTLNGHTSDVGSLCPLSATQFVSGSWDNSIKIWEKQGDSWQCTKTLNGHTSYVGSLCPLSVTEFVSGAADKSIKIWVIVPKQIDPIKELIMLVGKHPYQGNVNQIEINRSMLQPEYVTSKPKENLETFLECVKDLDALFVMHNPANRSIKIKFTGEVGDDAGGLSREFVSLAIKALLRALRLDLLYSEPSDVNFEPMMHIDNMHQHSYSYYKLLENIDKKKVVLKALYLLGRLFGLVLKNPDSLGFSLAEENQVWALAACLEIFPRKNYSDSPWRFKQFSNALLTKYGSNIGLKTLLSKESYSKENKATAKKAFDELRYSNIGKKIKRKGSTITDSIFKELAETHGYKGVCGIIQTFASVFDSLNKPYKNWMFDHIKNIMTVLLRNKFGRAVEMVLQEFIIPSAYKIAFRNGLFEELQFTPAEQARFFELTGYFTPDNMFNFLGASGSNFTLGFSNTNIGGGLNPWLTEHVSTAFTTQLNNLREQVNDGDAKAKSKLRLLLETVCGSFTPAAPLKVNFSKHFHSQPVACAIGTCFKSFDFSLAYLRPYLLAPVYYMAMMKKGLDVDLSSSPKIAEKLKEVAIATTDDKKLPAKYNDIVTLLLADSGIDLSNNNEANKYFNLVGQWVSAFHEKYTSHDPVAVVIAAKIQELIAADADIDNDNVTNVFLPLIDPFVKHIIDSELTTGAGAFTMA